MTGVRSYLLAVVVSSIAGAVPRSGDTAPIFFIANRGQAPAAVRFMVKGSGLTAYFLPGETDLDLGGSTLRLRLEGAYPGHRVAGEGLLSGRANFLRGSKSTWTLDVPLYESLIYRGVYPGIDMRYGGTGPALKSEFRVSPGADPNRIRIRYSGGGPPWVDTDGSLVVDIGDQRLREHPPLVYQEVDGVRHTVSGRFRLLSAEVVGFELGEYDRTRVLVIDPVLSYSTLLGGSGADTATALAVDASGSAYIAGYTDSFNFPALNAAQSFNAGGNDVFVAKLSPGGNSLVYCTYLGGSADDRAYGIAVDAQGNAYVTGSTTSSNFPVRAALQSKLAGSRNAFIVKLNPAGNGLVYGTYLGGNASDSANGIALDASGAAYVAGDTTSFSFPATGFQRGTRGGQEAFVAKLSADGARLVFSSYLGGSGDDRGTAIAVDPSGAVYVTGSTFSADFPVANPAQRNNAGGQDAFVTRFSADGNSLLFSTYLGGAGGTVANPEIGQAISIDAQGNAYVAGVTGSTDFPRLNALQTSIHGQSDAFVSKLTSAGVLTYSTYLGGSSADTATGIAVDANGNALVSGYTYSTDLAVTAAIQGSNAGEYDAFVAELNPSGNALLYFSYLGGNGADAASSIALDLSGNVFVAGWTMSTNFPLLNSYQSVNAGNYGSFVAKILFSTMPASVGVTPSSGSGASQVFSLQYSDPGGAANLTTVGMIAGGSANLAGACAVSYDRSRNALSLLTDAGQLPASSITPGSGVQQNSQCSLSGAGSSVSISGQILTLNLSLTFLPAFAGAKNIYMQAANSSGSTAWQAKGTWTSESTAVMSAPTPNTALSGPVVTFTWSASTSATAYWLDVGTVQGQGNIFATLLAPSVLSQTVNGIPSNGSTVYVRLWTQLGGEWQYHDYSYTAANLGAPVTMSSPEPGSTLSDSAVTFTWTASATPTAYWLDVGTAQGQGNIFANQLAPVIASQTVNGIPTNGGAIYVRLWIQVNGAWQHQDYTYAAANVGALATMRSPAPGSTLGGSSVIFTWTTGTGASARWLDVGTVKGEGNIVGSQLAASITSQTVNGIPANGGTIYVRLWTQISGTWQYNDYTYTAH